MLKKNKNQKQIIFKYFEPSHLIWEVVLFILKREGWLQRDHFQSGDKNLFKIQTKTFNCIIDKFIKNQAIVMTITRKNIGNQRFAFEFENYKNRTLLQVSTTVNIDNEDLKKEAKKIVTNYASNMRHFDHLVRDELERRGLKAYF